MIDRLTDKIEATDDRNQEIRLVEESLKQVQVLYELFYVKEGGISWSPLLTDFFLANPHVSEHAFSLALKKMHDAANAAELLIPKSARGIDKSTSRGILTQEIQIARQSLNKELMTFVEFVQRQEGLSAHFGTQAPWRAFLAYVQKVTTHDGHNH